MSAICEQKNIENKWNKTEQIARKERKNGGSNDTYIPIMDIQTFIHIKQ
jgi:hypothetical protein